MTCIFCKIANKNIETDIIYENESIIAFPDIQPKAPIHILIIPKTHIPTVNDIDASNIHIMGDITLAAQAIAKTLNVHNDGYKLNINCNRGGGQEVFHLHCHLIAGM